jgi:hypothetical protein
MRLFVLLALVLLSLVSRAGFVVNDPKKVLADLATWEHPATFETAMACGQSAVIDFTTLHCDLKCTRSWCESKCESAHDKSTAFYGLHVDECSKDLAHIFGDNGLILDIPKADYIAGGNSYVLAFLRGIGVFLQPEGTVTLLNWSPSSVQMIDGGQLKTVTAYQIHGEISYGDPTAQTQQFDLEVTDQLGGIRQVLMFSINQDIFFRVHGVISQPWAPPHVGGL